MTLDKLKIGSSGVITAVGGDGPLRCRLLDMGLTPRTRVTLQKVAPMGDPIEIRYRHDDPSVAAPVNGSPLGIQGPILIIAGLALLAFGARWTIVKLL